MHPGCPRRIRRAGRGRWLAALLLFPVCRLTAGDAPFRPGEAELGRLRERHAVLTARLAQLEPRVAPDLHADVAVFAHAVGHLLRFPERFFRAECPAEALTAVEDGLRRADELERGAPGWVDARGAVARGFRSALDGSVQPCALWVPRGHDPRRPARLDVILHGRSRTLNMVSFLANVRSGRIVASETGRTGEPDVLKLYVFGRGNTSSMWAGEADVFEAIEFVRSRFAIDPDRIVLRGFSMGGSSAWQLGLHHPSRWAAVEAGAGFVQTRPEVLATIREPWHFPPLAIHDAANCSLNLALVPFFAYAGTADEQFAQHAIIQGHLARDGLDAAQLPRVRFASAEGVGHSMRPEMKREADAFVAAALPRRVPAEFRFGTYTPRYGEFGDFRIDALERLYERAEIEGTADRIRTKNVWVLRLAAARTLEIDGQRLTGAVFHKTAAGWRTGEPGGLRKRAGLQGPIDDAFQERFLCVPPTTGDDPVLEEFRREFACYLHGEVRVKPAAAVTESDLAACHLVLFGDPATNPLIRRVLPGLPLRWTEREIAIAGRTFPAATHTAVLVFPNPLNPSRYVVLNTGHTFSPRLFDDLHWYLYPRFGDYAVLDRRTRTPVLAGFFDRSWRIPEAP